MFYHSTKRNENTKTAAVWVVGSVCLFDTLTASSSQQKPASSQVGRQGCGDTVHCPGNIKFQQNHPLHFSVFICMRTDVVMVGICSACGSSTNWRRGLVGIGVAPRVLNHWAIYSVPTKTQPFLLQPSFQQINHHSLNLSSAIYRCYMYIHTHS